MHFLSAFAFADATMSERGHFLIHGDERQHSISYERDQFGVKAVTCSCGWSFRGWRAGFSDTNAQMYHRASPLEFDTAIRDHERAHDRKAKL